MKPRTTTAGRSRRRTPVEWRVAAAAAAALLLPACSQTAPAAPDSRSIAPGSIVQGQGPGPGQGTAEADSVPEPTATPAAPALVPAAVPVRPATPQAAAAAVPVPTTLTVAGTSINMVVVPVGVAAGAAMELPEAFDQAGWYRFGPAPGAASGTAVIAGHIDTTSDRAPFSQLKTLAAGTAIEVGRREAPTLTYRVVSVELMAKDSFDGDSLFRRAGPHELKVVTCGGRWLDERMDYSDNVIVTAVLD